MLEKGYKYILLLIDPVKTEISIGNVLLTICVRRVGIVTGYFLFEKQTLIVLLKLFKYINLTTYKRFKIKPGIQIWFPSFNIV